MRCPYCGTELIECVNGMLCPNHGLIIEKPRKEEKQDEDRKNN